LKDRVLEGLRAIAVIISHRRNVSVEVRDKVRTGFCTKDGRIVLTTRLIPRNLRKNPKIVKPFLEGLVAHEAGHLFKTDFDMWNKWMKRMSDKNLANFVRNLIEDVRVESYIRMVYRDDFGKRIDFMNRIIKMGMTPTNHLDELVYRLIYGGRSRLTGEVEKVISECEKRVKSIAHMSHPQKILPVATYVYRELKKITPYTSEMIRNCHVPYGEYDLSDVPVEDAERTAEEMGLSEEEREPIKISPSMKAAGKGSGLEIPPCQADPDEYNRIVSEVNRIVKKILDNLAPKLKAVVEPKVHEKVGVIPPSLLTRAYLMSFRRPVTRIYRRNVTKLEKAKVYWGILVDLSGSMTTWYVKRCLAVFAEVASGFLTDGSWALIVFGSEYMRIKTFVEPYHNVRYRIGGVECMGGTEMASPLRKFHEMFRDLPEGEKILLVVTDGVPDKMRECRRIIEQMRSDGIRVIGIGLEAHPSNMRYLFGEDHIMIGNLEELPEAFITIYLREQAL